MTPPVLRMQMSSLEAGSVVNVLLITWKKVSILGMLLVCLCELSPVSRLSEASLRTGWLRGLVSADR